MAGLRPRFYLFLLGLLMKFYKVLKPFQSPLIGNKIKGDVFQYGADSAKKWVDMGLIAEVSKETKPKSEESKESKPFSSKKKVKR
jgi:hypothetical protein